MVAFSGATLADELTWTSQFSGSPLKFLSFSSTANSSYSNTFNLIPAGFDPLNMTIESAVASFAFADDANDEEEWVNITLGGELFIQEEVDGSHPSSSFAWYSDDLSISLLADLQSDGKLDFKVQLLDTVWGKKEDTYLKVAKLVAHGFTNPPPPPPPPPHTVPDNSTTLFLLGAAFAGLFGLQKRFARRA